MNIYRDLLKQYNDATGSNCTDIYDKGFKQWLEIYSKDISSYLNFLEENGVYIDEFYIAELDKGPFDSLLVRKAVNKLNDRLISENATSLNISKKRLKIHKKEAKVLINGIYYPLEDYDAFMSYNLFRSKELERFSVLHNLGNSIIYGVFGRNEDIDKKIKLENVQRIYKNIDDGEFKLNYVEDNGKYYYLVKSRDEIIERKLVRSRY